MQGNMAGFCREFTGNIREFSEKIFGFSKIKL
jgi:hypothetical protein